MKVVKNKFLYNISWNLVGFVFPLITAIVAIPFIIKNIGTERFGILTLIYAIIGYMNVFDFGLTRSITKQVVKYKEIKKNNELLSSIITGWGIILIIILCISSLFWFFSDVIADKVFNPSNSVIRDEVKNCLLIISICLPFVISQSVFSGVMEAFGAFKKIAIGKIPFSFLMYAAPLYVSINNPNLISITSCLCVLRVIMAMYFYIIMNKVVSFEIGTCVRKGLFKYNIAIELIKFGGWVSISNVVAPIMLYIDRFFIASIIGAGVVAYYTTPYEIVSKMAIVSTSVCGVLFPVLVERISSDIKSANGLYWKSFWGIFFVLLIPVLIGVLGSHFILSTWINDEFARNSQAIFCIFLVGFMIHGLIQPAFTWIQSAGKPYITALSHLFDLTIYVCYFPVLVREYGILGAAYAWVIRVTISFFVLNTLRFILYKRGIKNYGKI